MAAAPLLHAPPSKLSLPSSLIERDVLVQHRPLRGHQSTNSPTVTKISEHDHFPRNGFSNVERAPHSKFQLCSSPKLSGSTDKTYQHSSIFVSDLIPVPFRSLIADTNRFPSLIPVPQGELLHLCIYGYVHMAVLSISTVVALLSIGLGRVL